MRFKALSAGIWQIYSTVERAEMLVFKVNTKIGIRFFESGGRRFDRPGALKIKGTG